MSSLYNRATPSQAAVLRIVEGAVKNATDAHPTLEISPRHRRSIAKRAAGTLTASWPDVLAAKRSSDSREPVNPTPGRGQPAHCLKRSGRRGFRLAKAPPLDRLHKAIAAELWDLERAGLTERVAAFIYVLRMIAKLRDT